MAHIKGECRMSKIVLNFFLFFFLFLPKALMAQAEEQPKLSWFTASVGYSKNTHFLKGDFGGLFVSSDYSVTVKKRFVYQFNLTATIHEGRNPILYLDLNNAWQKSELRHMTGGLQTGMQFGYNLMSKNNQLLSINLGSFVRYQITTFPDYYSLNFYPSSYFAASRYERSFSLGAIGSVCYTYFFNNNLVVQAKASLQYDTHEDALNMIGISVGRTFSISKTN